MWVVKISGSLNRDPLLPLWLELMAQLGGGRVTIMCGGGSFAEEARHANVHWRFDHNLHVHNMAVLAMSQAAYLASGLEPKLCLAVSEASVRPAHVYLAQAAIKCIARCAFRSGASRLSTYLMRTR